MDGRALTDEAARQVRAAGYLVTLEHQVTTSGKRTASIDLVAWAPNEGGELVPSFIVEVKKPTHRGHIERALAQLQFYMPLLNVESAFIFDGEWHLATPHFTFAGVAKLPQPQANLSEARASRELLEQLVQEALNRDRERSEEDSWTRLLAKLVQSATHLNETRDQKLNSELLALSRNPANRELLADVMTNRAELSGRASGEHTTPSHLAAAMARLLAPADGWTITDPFCGLGGCLRAVSIQARQENLKVKLSGHDVNVSTVERAQLLLQLANVDASIVNLNALKWVDRIAG